MKLRVSAILFFSNAAQATIQSGSAISKVDDKEQVESVFALEDNDPFLGIAERGESSQDIGASDMRKSLREHFPVRKRLSKVFLSEEENNPYLGVSEVVETPYNSSGGQRLRSRLYKSTEKLILSDEDFSPYLGIAEDIPQTFVDKPRKLMSIPLTDTRWYPDWEGDNVGCVNDGDAPSFMAQNVANYLFKAQAECCSKHYSWGYATCMGDGRPSSGIKYYADWAEKDTCKNDGNAPVYMVENPTMWLHDNLEECCTKRYSWKMNQCMGSAATDPGSGKYYPDWEGDNQGCIIDANTTLAPEYMISNPTAWMFDTIDACCLKYYSWNRAECAGSSSDAGSKLWYMDWYAGMCVKDCVGASGCGGLAAGWDSLFGTRSECCKAKNSWNSKCDS